MAAAAARPREDTPPPIIGKLGRYTVFVTPPASPKTPSQSPQPPAAAAATPSPSPSPSCTPRTSSPLAPKSAAPPSSAAAAPPSSAAAAPPALQRKITAPSSPTKAVHLSPARPPPVQVPPPQFEKASSRSSNSGFGFFWDTVAKVQAAHSRLDECLADWLGLDQSRYQWALNDYHERKGMAKEGGKTKDLANKSQNV